MELECLSFARPKKYGGMIGVLLVVTVIDVCGALLELAMCLLR